MSGAGLMDFLITLVELAIMVGLSWLALVKIAPDDWFNQIGRYAIGGAALIVFLLAIKAVLFGGGGAAILLSPIGVIEFAIGLIVLVIIVTLTYMGIDYFAPAPPLATTIKYVVGGIAIIALLVIAGKTIFGGGLGMIPPGTFRLR